MAAPKYPGELRERATRMAAELRQDPATKAGAIARVAEQLGMHPEDVAWLGPSGRDRWRCAAGDDDQ